MKVLLDKQFVFIIGAPRSGTTWLQAMLGAHPSICTLTELKLYNDFTAPWLQAWKTQASFHKYGNLTGLPVIWTENEFYTFLREFLDRVYSRVLISKPNASVVLDKTPGYAFYVEDINDLVPNAKYIHMVRDGRDVTTSMCAAAQDWAKAWAPSNVKAAATLWKRSILSAQKAQQYCNRYMEVRYEELLTNGPEVLGNIFTFIGVPIDVNENISIFNEHAFEQMKKQETAINQFYQAENFFRKGQTGDWQNALSPAQRLIFHDVAGDLLCALGYADDSWWSNRWHHRFTLPLLNKSRRTALLSRAVKRLLGPIRIGL
jgi:hypothetical protein